jgi:hypothetical protein
MPEVIARITLKSSSNFEIKRSLSQGTDFHPFLADGKTDLYAGDQLKVPQGSTVWVMCVNNGQIVKSKKVQVVPDDDIPWAVTNACP